MNTLPQLLFRAVPLTFCLLAVACGGNEEGSSNASGGGSGGMAGAPSNPENLERASTSIGPVTATVGGENTVCMHRRLGNEKGGFVRRVRGTLTEGSHHMIVYLAPDDEQEDAEPYNCQGFAGIIDTGGQGIPVLEARNVPFFIAQTKNEDLQLPNTEDDVPVGFRIEPNQMLMIELHWFNTTPQEQQVVGDIEVDMITDDRPVMESSFGFWGTVNIDIPPNSKADTGVLWQRALADTNVFGLTTHQHQRGTRMSVWKSDGLEVSEEQSMADNTDWEDPPLERFDPPISFGPGEGMAYRCQWNNATNAYVDFGEDFDDEMCFFWFYYYPSLDFDICFHFRDDSPTAHVCNHFVR